MLKKNVKDFIAHKKDKYSLFTCIRDKEEKITFMFTYYFVGHRVSPYLSNRDNSFLMYIDHIPSILKISYISVR